MIKYIKNHFDFKINKYIKKNNTSLIDTNKGRFLVKEKKHDNYELFKYLKSCNFNNFIDLYSADDRYEVYPYVEKIEYSFEQKALDIVYVITLLHNKTTFYKQLDIDLVKRIYEDITNKLIYLTNFYDELLLSIENDRYTSPSKYLFLRNCSIIFNSIDASKYYIDKWYNLMKDKNNYRVCTIHNNLDIDHLIKTDNLVLVSWNNSCKASPVYDLLSLYNNTYDKLSFSTLYDAYNSRYPLLKEEEYLLFCLMLFPSKLNFSFGEVLNTKSVYELSSYLISANDFVSQYKPNDSYSNTN